MSSSLLKAQTPVRARGSNKCPHHAGNQVIFVCEDCGELICSKCVSTIHRKHAVDDISEIILQVKVTIQDFVNKAENSYIPELTGELKNLDDEISKNKNHFKDVITQIRKQNETLKQKLDIITGKSIALCLEVESGNDGILETHKKELQTRIEKLNASLLELKDTLQSGTNTDVYDISREIPNAVSIPALPTLQDMDFKPTLFSLVQLEELVGEFSQTTGDSRTQTESFVDPDQQREMSTKIDSNSDKPSSSNVERFKTFQTIMFTGTFDSIRATSNNQVWVKYDGELQLLNDTGKTQSRNKMEVRITDFSVSPCDIWFCSDSDNSVRKVTGDKSTVMFHTDTVPLSICISADGNILVGMDQQIVKYSQSGQILCKSGAEVKWLIKQVPLVKYPRRISQCPVTRNIAVVDWNFINHGGDGRKHVSIFSEDLQLLCRYYGHNAESSSPWDVCYSDTGDIYIADRKNNSIQQISGRGEFIQSVYIASNKQAYYLCVQSDGDIWAVFGGTFTANEITILQKQ